MDARPYKQRFVDSMDDDFNTAQALATLFDLAREINRADEAGADASAARDTLKELAGILGLTLAEEAAVDVNTPIEISAAESKSWQLDTSTPTIGDLMALRQQFRKDKKWQLAYEVRLCLDKKGLILEDTPKGTICKRKR